MTILKIMWLKYKLGRIMKQLYCQHSDGDYELITHDSLRLETEANLLLDRLSELDPENCPKMRL